MEAKQDGTKVGVGLTGVPETMLWTLHNRAGEALRADRFLEDPVCVDLYTSIAYEYEKRFGRPDGTHAMRSRIFDDVLRPWLRAHPGGAVVELAAGLETQFHRCDDGEVRWTCVDLPEAIAVRDRLLPPSPRCRHVAKSVLDLGWMEAIDARRGVFVTAQGLFMYLEEAEVRRVFSALVERFPGVEIMFDTIPRWFSRRTLRGYARTRHYMAPPMPWGVAGGELEPLLRRWSPRIATVSVRPYGFPRGPGRGLVWLAERLAWLRNRAPSIAHVTTGPPAGA
jgi:O-methyltransferase involved in polyketide biosynthesis